MDITKLNDRELRLQQLTELRLIREALERMSPVPKPVVAAPVKKK